MSRKQYNAAVKYLEKNAYRIKRVDSIVAIGTIIGISYFVILYVYKILSCIR